MRYKPDYKAKMRRELLSVAGKTMKEKGFSATGIDGLMQDAGVTSGAFYGHFSSKAELLKALVVSELETSAAMWGEMTDADPTDWLRHQARRYLSMGHVSNPQVGCILPALASEISRADEETRTLLTEELKKWKESVAARLEDKDSAWAFIAQLVGGVLLARAVADQSLQQTILSESRRFLETSIPERQTSKGDL